MEELLLKFTRYLEGERKASKYTVRNYQNDLRPFIAFAAKRGVSTPDGVDRAVIRAYLGALMVDKVSKRSIARKLSAIRSFYRFMNIMGYASGNAAASASSPKLDRRLPDFLPEDSTKLLLEAPDTSTPLGIRDRAIVEIIYAAGLRVSEAAGLNTSDINMKERELRVMGKGSKERITIIGKLGRHWLSEYMKTVRPELLKKQQNVALFLNNNGRRISVRAIQMIIKRYSKLVGLSNGVHTHTLRHTYATHMLDGGADLRVVQELMGHASLSTTQIYMHVTQAQARKVYLSAHPLAKNQATPDKIEKLVSGNEDTSY